MKTIYILEDDRNIRELIQMVLETNGYEVKTSSTIKEFNKVENRTTPDLFLLDFMLPDGDGLDVCRNLKNLERTRHVPVILMSAHPNIHKLEGADAILPKPFDIDELIHLISSQID